MRNGPTWEPATNGSAATPCACSHNTGMARRHWPSIITFKVVGMPHTPKDSGPESVRCEQILGIQGSRGGFRD